MDTGENLENLSIEQLEQIEQKLDNNQAPTSEPQTDWKAKYEEVEKRNAILQRIVNKRDKLQTQNNQQAPAPVNNDLAEIKYYHKVEQFAEQSGLTKAQAKYILDLKPDATPEVLKDPFFAEGVKAMARKETLAQSIPTGGSIGTVNGKSFSEMTREERVANYAKIVGGQ